MKKIRVGNKTVVVTGGEASTIPKDVRDRIEPILARAVAKKEGTVAVMLNPKDFKTKEEQEALTWLAMSCSLDGQKCIECGYEWTNKGGVNEKGEPAWRDKYRKNPAYSLGKGKFICERCKYAKRNKTD